MARSKYNPAFLPVLRKGEQPGDGLKRVFLQCLRIAADAVPDDVHKARLAMKRARAVLRLAEACGLRGAIMARRRIGAQARRLAATRDRTVVAELARKFAGKVSGAEKQSVLAVLSRSKRKAQTPLPRSWGRQLAELGRRLSREAWPATDRRISRALSKSVDRARNRHRAARKRPDAHAVHEWRKSVVALREQLYVMGTRMPHSRRQLPDRLHEISRRLGKAGDWNLLIEASATARAGAEDERGRRNLIARAEKSRRKTIRRAHRLWREIRDDLDVKVQIRHEDTKFAEKCTEIA